MCIEVQGNSPAEGAWGHTLVTGRAKAAAEYLTSIGVKNSLSETGVKSDFIGLRVFPSGSTSRPASCAEDGDRALPAPAPGISVSLDTAGSVEQIRC